MIEAIYVCHSGDDMLVVNAARVSFKKRSWDSLTEADRRLIAFLADHQHWTPFAHPQITLHMKAPIFVRTQCFKHKVGFVENEISRRYVDEEPDFFAPEGWRSRAPDKKQGSGPELGTMASANATCSLESAHEDALGHYHSLLATGVAPEQARMVLPQSMITEWFWTGSLAAWARFYLQRTHSTGQAETAGLARSAADLIQPLYPVSWRALTLARVQPE